VSNERVIPTVEQARETYLALKTENDAVLKRIEELRPVHEEWLELCAKAYVRGETQWRHPIIMAEADFKVAVWRRAMAELDAPADLSHS
jgi:hypothetical protein